MGTTINDIDNIDFFKKQLVQFHILKMRVKLQ